MLHTFAIIVAVMWYLIIGLGMAVMSKNIDRPKNKKAQFMLWLVLWPFMMAMEATKEKDTK